MKNQPHPISAENAEKKQTNSIPLAPDGSVLSVLRAEKKVLELKLKIVEDEIQHQSKDN